MSQASENQHKVEVAVVTTSGTYPSEGYETESIKEKVDVILKRAADKLRITDTARWVAKVAGRTIEPQKSYQENSLTGRIDIDWGPSEGGGGAK